MTTTQTTLKIQGMSCQNCVNHATQALKETPGVIDAQVTLTPPQAIVSHNTQTTPEQLIAAVEEEGYDATTS